MRYAHCWCPSAGGTALTAGASRGLMGMAGGRPRQSPALGRPCRRRLRLHVFFVVHSRKQSIVTRRVRLPPPTSLPNLAYLFSFPLAPCPLALLSHIIHARLQLGRLPTLKLYRPAPLDRVVLARVRPPVTAPEAVHTRQAHAPALLRLDRQWQCQLARLESARKRPRLWPPADADARTGPVR